ncbi:MAG TPA: TA system VapC family ribonuclease toxin [Candidatus Dormibacteraeota bacterium]|nr:TA system VapC family ribonuclease toxin [Candidatus Dormibacteraeota bacterium]
MIAVDTNLLVYAHRRDATWHEPAHLVVRRLAEGRAPWAIPWPCLREFLAIVTHPRIYRPPTPPETALDQVAAWLESPSLSLLAEGPGCWELFRTLVARGRVTGPLVHDASIAALCLLHGARELWTADRDFGRFVGLRTRNPLLEP